MKDKLSAVGVPFAGALPEDSLLSSVRLDEIMAQLGANLIFGEGSVLDKECSEIIIASQR